MAQGLPQGLAPFWKRILLHLVLRDFFPQLIDGLRLLSRSPAHAHGVVHHPVSYTHLSHPRRLAHILDDFPKLEVIGAHFGGWSLWDLAMEYLLDRSCWLDTSSSFAFLGKVRSKEIIRAYGADRLLFGDDFPMWDHKTEVETLLSLDLTDDEYEKIFSGNAKRLLRMTPNP